MIRRTYIGMPAQITFTMDFHELLTGDLRPGYELRISYDPLRIASAEEPVAHGDPSWPIIAHLRFGGDEPATSVELTSAGMVETPLADPKGQHGLMLSGELVVPEDALLVSLWFTCTTTKGEQLVDNDGGATYCFRFPSQDILLRSATVASAPRAKTAEFAVELSAVPQVDKVSIRYHVVNHPQAAEGDVELAPNGEHDKEGRVIWSCAGVSVPVGALIKYKIHYWIGGFRYKEDNSSSYFLAPQQPAEEVPPPPKELVEAVRTWKW
jgi:Family of unknown function (DUF6209)